MVEMFLRKIPEDMRPWECNVNGVKYVYPAGTEQNVPAEVAALIDAYWEKQEVDYPETGISFNDLRDRPFGDSTEVLFDQRVELTQFTYVHSEELAISDGDTVKVTWNGTEYECTASIVSEDGMEAVVVGNLFGAGTEPFFIGVGSSFGGTAIMDMSGILTEVTVKIEKSVIHTIDPKFLPGGGGGGGVVLYTDGPYLNKSEKLGESNRPSKTEVFEYAKNGGFVIATPDWGEVYFPQSIFVGGENGELALVYCNDGESSFCFRSKEYVDGGAE